MCQVLHPGTSLAIQWLRIRLAVQGMQVQSLVGELRSRAPQRKIPRAATK